jgi:hypothetical protein
MIARHEENPFIRFGCGDESVGKGVSHEWDPETMFSDSVGFGCKSTEAKGDGVADI